MSWGFCAYCGLQMEAKDAVATYDHNVHRRCLDAYNAEIAAAAKRPKTSMEQQLDRIEGLLMAIRDRYSL